MSDHENGSSVAWFLAGIGLGAAAALLMAPQSGRETREEIRRRAELGRERAREASRQAAERSREYYERGRQLANEAAERGKHVADRGREMYDRGRKLADETAQRFKKDVIHGTAPITESSDPTPEPTEG